MVFTWVSVQCLSYYKIITLDVGKSDAKHFNSFRLEVYTLDFRINVDVVLLEIKQSFFFTTWKWRITMPCSFLLTTALYCFSSTSMSLLRYGRPNPLNCGCPLKTTAFEKVCLLSWRESIQRVKVEKALAIFTDYSIVVYMEVEGIGDRIYIYYVPYTLFPSKENHQLFCVSDTTRKRTDPSATIFFAYFWRFHFLVYLWWTLWIYLTVSGFHSPQQAVDWKAIALKSWQYI